MTETLSIKVPRELKARLQAQARVRKTTPSALLRRALEEVVARPIARASLLDRNRDLFETLDRGPKDLSTHPRHLHGYGR